MKALDLKRPLCGVALPWVEVRRQGIDGGSRDGSFRENVIIIII